ncbi:DUF4873 domain-containing protein [Streptomyces sp. NBC_01506]|uniref:DUF4873 domain-containing protein n=1 Tax=Streptomyces sp. NBC_01506 TaxID=2903887 RepID=UPI00386ACB9F
MSNYQGPATLIVGAIEISVVATLSGDRSGGAGAWGGSVQTEGAADGLYEPSADDGMRIRLPDGREGSVLATRTAIGSGRMRISGSGDIPF